MNLRKIFLLIVLFPFLLNAQSVKRLVKNGDRAFKEQDYFLASEYYEKAHEISPIEEATYKWALSEYNKRNYKKSLKLFQKVAENSLNEYPLCSFYIAMNFNSLGQYQKANRVFHMYYRKHRRNRDYYTLKAKQAVLATEKAFAMSLEADTIQLELEEALSEGEYSELLFRAVGPNESFLIAKRPINELDTFYTSRLFLVANDSIQALDTNINNQYFNISGFCYTDKKNELLISACSQIDGEKQCLIYKTELKDSVWSPLTELPVEVNLPEAKNIHPYYFSFQNKSYLLFSSNYEEGDGGFDLYYSEYKDGKYKKAKSLGRRLNSIDNEISPIYDTVQQKLYFSSEWFYNNGGYDIFYSEGEFPDLGVPENMGRPINSNYDDLFYSWSYDYSRAYLSSNRLNAEATQSESCCNDIFSYQLPEIERDTVVDTLIFVKKIEKMEQLIPIDLFFDNDHPNPRTRDTVTNLTYEETYQQYFAKVTEYENKFSEGLKKEAKTNAVTMIDDFFYGKVEAGFDKLKEFNFSMIKLLREGYEIKLTVKGFASPLNSSDYNVNLSKRRVSSIINYYRTVEDGLYMPFIDGTAEKGTLSIVEEAFGEDTAGSTISDDRLDTRNSIYSPWAAEERRVQLVAFKLGKNNPQ